MSKHITEEHSAKAGETRDLTAPRPFLPDGAFTSASLPSMGRPEATAFMRRVYDAQVRGKLARGNSYFPGVPEDELAEVEDGHLMLPAARDDCRWLLYFAREDIQRYLAAHPKTPKITIGVASAYRSPVYDGRKWFDAFQKHYKNTERTRAAYPGGAHGPEAFRLLLGELTVAKAPGGFSNHSRGRAVDFKTSQVLDGERFSLTANTSQHLPWKRSWFFGWLKKNASQYRFVNYKKEEWHYDHDADLVVPGRAPIPEKQFPEGGDVLASAADGTFKKGSHA